MAKMVQTKVEAAASSAGEADFLAKIAADLGNHDNRLVYADWLEEQKQDAKAKFVRQFVKAAQALEPATKFPKGKGLPAAWLRMLGVPLFEGLVEHDLLAVQNIVLRLARPVAIITTKPTADKNLAVGASKFGGQPDLPKSADWPSCAHGPLGFLGQLALTDLRFTQAGRQLPASGMLSFFAYQSAETGYQPGVVEEVPGDTRVIYHADTTSLVRRTAPDELETDDGIFPSCRLILAESWDLPVAGDTGIDEIQELDGFDDLRSVCHLLDEEEVHHLLGYQVHGRTDNTAPGPDWRQLITFASDDNLGWSWCDGEHLDVYIHEDDLRRHKFKRIYGYAS